MSSFVENIVRRGMGAAPAVVPRPRPVASPSHEDGHGLEPIPPADADPGLVVMRAPAVPSVAQPAAAQAPPAMPPGAPEGAPAVPVPPPPAARAVSSGMPPAVTAPVPRAGTVAETNLPESAAARGPDPAREASVVRARLADAGGSPGEGERRPTPSRRETTPRRDDTPAARLLARPAVGRPASRRARPEPFRAVSPAPAAAPPPVRAGGPDSRPASPSRPEDPVPTAAAQLQPSLPALSQEPDARAETEMTASGAARVAETGPTPAQRPAEQEALPGVDAPQQEPAEARAAPAPRGPSGPPPAVVPRTKASPLVRPLHEPAGAEPEEPSVHVHIGTIEIRAATAPPPAAAKGPTWQGFDDYGRIRTYRRR